MKTVMRTMMLFVIVMTMSRRSEADSTECVNSLMPCINYLKVSNPPASCCNALKTAIETQKACLCSGLTNPELLKSLGITADEASTFPARCKIEGVSTALCSSSTASPSPGPATSTSTSTSPAATSGKNGGNLVAWSGVSFGVAMMSCLLFY